MGAGFAGSYQCFEHLCRILPEGGGDFGAGNGSGVGIAIGLVGNLCLSRIRMALVLTFDIVLLLVRKDNLRICKSKGIFLLKSIALFIILCYYFFS